MCKNISNLFQILIKWEDLQPLQIKNRSCLMLRFAHRHSRMGDKQVAFLNVLIIAKTLTSLKTLQFQKATSNFWTQQLNKLINILMSFKMIKKIIKILKEFSKDKQLKKLQNKIIMKPKRKMKIKTIKKRKMMMFMNCLQKNRRILKKKLPNLRTRVI